MSRFKTAPISPSYHNGIVGKRKGSRVRFWDPATATLSKWTRDPEFVAQSAAVHAEATSLTSFAETVSDTFNANATGESIYGRMTVAELRDLAKARGIKVLSKARKADLITALTN